MSWLWHAIRPLSWTWVIKRLLISTFVIAHLAATAVFVIPNCPIRARYLDLSIQYLFPLGLWQNWALFAPDPVKETLRLEAMVFDRHGIIRVFAFPTNANRHWLEKLLHFRHTKFAACFFMKEDFAAQREIAARHVVRNLKIPSDAFPVTLQFIYQAREAPALGAPLADAFTPFKPYDMGSYRFASLMEAQP